MHQSLWDVLKCWLCLTTFLYWLRSTVTSMEVLRENKWVLSTKKASGVEKSRVVTCSGNVASMKHYSPCNQPCLGKKANRFLVFIHVKVHQTFCIGLFWVFSGTWVERAGLESILHSRVLPGTTQTVSWASGMSSASSFSSWSSWETHLLFKLRVKHLSLYFINRIGCLVPVEVFLKPTRKTTYMLQLLYSLQTSNQTTAKDLQSAALPGHDHTECCGHQQEIKTKIQSHKIIIENKQFNYILNNR